LFIFSLFIVIFLEDPSFAQSEFRGEISGKISDISNGNPIAVANVFLTNTTLGSITDKKGYYTIKNVPFGTYELVVSMMGYKLQKKTIQLYDLKERTYNFKLKPRVLPGEEVSITAKYPKEWKKNLKVFERVFFGVKKFAKECKFKNPEVLDFEYDRSSGQFKAFSDMPIMFLNNAMGYEVTFFIEEFMAKLYNDRLDDIFQAGDKKIIIKRGSLHWNGTIIFKEIKQTKRSEKRKWEKNRLVAYNGSKFHFFRSLCKSRLEDDGFEICGVERFSSSWENKLEIKDILKQTSNPSQFLLFFHNYLKITYKKESDDIKYHREIRINEMLNPDFEHMERWRTDAMRECRYQHSWIDIENDEPIIIDSNGVIISGKNRLIVELGYWRWNAAAEWLPIEYQPPKNEK